MSSGHPGWNLRVLIVDDEKINRMILKNMVGKLVAEVWEAANGLEALTALEGFEADLVITDLTMPAMDGLELIREMRQRNLKSHVLVVTGHEDPQSHGDEQLVPASDYLIKPLRPDLLEAALARVAQAAGIGVRTP